jgi:2'-5' RNA ligase
VSGRHRLFFALVPGERVRSDIQVLQKSIDGCGRAVPPAQFHVTLAFLGMQEPAVIPEVCAIASRLSFEPCQLVLNRPGSFRNGGVLWLGADTIPAPLRKFRHALIDALLDAGIGHDRKTWKFHVTLYRRLRKRPSIMDSVAIEWALNSFSLIESVSVRSGVEYHSLGRWPAGS